MKLVRVLLSNRRAVFLCGPILKRKIKKFFRYRPKGYFFSPRYKMMFWNEKEERYQHVWDGYVNLMKYGSVPSGLFLEQKATIKKALGIKFSIVDKRKSLQFKANYPLTVRSKIRDTQREAVDRMVENSNTGGLILQGTGTGKTFVAGAFLSRLKAPAVFLVDELTLLRQTKEELESVMGEEIGIVGGGEFSPKRCTVATVQTLQGYDRKGKRRKLFREWFKKLSKGAVIVDEFHLAMNSRTESVLAAVKPMAVYGLTATLQTDKDAVRLPAAAMAGPVIYRYSLKQGEQDKILSEGVVCRVAWPSKPMEDDYAAAYHSGISHCKKRNDVVEELIYEGRKRKLKIIAIVERLAHLRILSKRLTRRGIAHTRLSGADSQEDRTIAKKAMDAGSLEPILATRIFTKGINIKTVDVILDAGATRSTNNAQQRFGRGARRTEEKTRFIYIDIADTRVRSGTETNHFSAAAKQRLKALRQLGVPVINIPWKGKDSAKVVYNRALKQV